MSHYKRNKLNKRTIESIVNTIAGAKCIIKFYGADEAFKILAM